MEDRSDLQAWAAQAEAGLVMLGVSARLSISEHPRETQIKNGVYESEEVVSREQKKAPRRVFCTCRGEDSGDVLLSRNL